ncbi:MAG: hypothetical protein LC808_39695 [Actinobacteria bacterium]|nr:hypothetical protein [Actinomycetota bacterium]
MTMVKPRCRKLTHERRQDMLSRSSFGVVGRLLKDAEVRADTPAKASVGRS